MILAIAAVAAMAVSDPQQAPALSAAAAPEPPEVVSPSVETPDPPALAMAREILDLTNPPAERERVIRDKLSVMFSSAMASQTDTSDIGKQNALKIEQGIANMISNLTAHYMPIYIDALAHAYCRQFTLSELTQIRDFAATPVGRRFVSIGSVVYRDPDVIAAQRKMMGEFLATQSHRTLPPAGNPR